jgi:hypothetical protein
MYDWLGPVLTYNIFPSIDSMSTNTSAKIFGKSAVKRKVHLIFHHRALFLRTQYDNILATDNIVILLIPSETYFIIDQMINVLL